MSPPVSVTEAMFLVHLSSYKWNDTAPYPKIGVIAQEMGVSHQAVRGYARSLEKKGYLERQFRGRSNFFKWEKLIKALELRYNQEVEQACQAPPVDLP
jgi:predicted transcriptional regulator